MWRRTVGRGLKWDPLILYPNGPWKQLHLCLRFLMYLYIVFDIFNYRNIFQLKIYNHIKKEKFNLLNIATLFLCQNVYKVLFDEFFICFLCVSKKNESYLEINEQNFLLIRWGDIDIKIWSKNGKFLENMSYFVGLYEETSLLQKTKSLQVLRNEALFMT